MPADRRTRKRSSAGHWRCGNSRVAKQDFLLLTSRALARRTVAPSDIIKAGMVIRRDEDIAPEELVDKLIAGGYVREDPIGAIGEFSIRGRHPRRLAAGTRCTGPN